MIISNIKRKNKIIIFFILLLIILFLNFVNNLKSEKKRKTQVIMCTVAKKENRYIKYFIKFYKKLGYNHIYFYDNNEPEDESISDLEIVKDEIRNGFISIIDWKIKVKKLVTKSYYDCYEKFNKENDWISFFDIDEYLILEPNNLSIQEFLNNPRFDDCDLVKFNWRVFTDNEQLEWIDKPLIERFPIETNYKYENRHVKSTIRGRLDYTKFRKNFSPHSIYNNIKACSSSGKKTDWKYYLWPPDLKYASLNHYVTKSIREFFFKKYKTKVDVDTIKNETKKYLFDYFFKVNRKTHNKVEIFNQIYHTNYK